ncbi:STAS domain-containing protein [Chitinophaga arvensicola]|uniref:RsbT co-antagonist protein RsbR n=1 Tax=Chitinophaga arvensicola TaxID=29529 RepID=A0A1I0R873_9BACT|nr:STAS domain-containing protein [Chitinophaga arvensicola]SEW36919.1 rsbT co-antagonist protein RsbR [Chitinophaga arvensicola]
MKTDIAKLLQRKKKQIFENWVAAQLADSNLRDELMSNEELRSQSDELLDVLLKTINNDNLSDVYSQAFEPVREILAGISVFRAKNGYTPTETGLYVFGLKEAFLQAIQGEMKSDLPGMIEVTFRMNKLMDHLAIDTFDTFIKGREEVILRQTDEITEISTPVIRVWDGILALPIIGTLDSSRTQVVMENLLQEIVVSGSTIAILDISGVPAVDSLVAQHLIKTVAATRLMGAECIISGIRPEIAQTVVHLGIDLSSIVTKATLASALRHAFTMLKLEVKRVQREKSI